MRFSILSFQKSRNTCWYYFRICHSRRNYHPNLWSNTKFIYL